MNFKQFLTENDPTGWGGSYEKELSDIKGNVENLISKDKKTKSKPSKQHIKSKNYQAKDKKITSGMEGQIKNTELRMKQYEDKIIYLEQIIGRLKEQASKQKAGQQKEGLRRQIEGYNNQLKNIKTEVSKLIKNKHELINKHNESLQRKREEVSKQAESESKSTEKNNSDKENNSKQTTNSTEKKDSKNTEKSPGYDSHGYGIEKPVKPEIIDNWEKFTEADVQKLKNYYRDLIEYNEKLRQKTGNDNDINIRKKSLTYAGIIARLQEEIRQLDKDWAKLKEKQQKKRKRS